MDQMKLWNQFLRTGALSDYLNFKNQTHLTNERAAAKTPAAEPQESIQAQVKN